MVRKESQRCAGLLQSLPGRSAHIYRGSIWYACVEVGGVVYSASLISRPFTLRHFVLQITEFGNLSEVVLPCRPIPDCNSHEYTVVLQGQCEFELQLHERWRHLDASALH